ncbi:MAG TPA: HAD-IA family hydrolase [Bellilinea sp.]
MPVTTIIFDAGDTLIALNSDDTRPMVEWDVLEAVPGVKEMLERLNGRHRLAVGSNADVSDGPMLAAALARLGIVEYFSDFFSSVDLGVRKPEPAYFKIIENSMNVLPSEVVMVGDSYVNDVLGAVQAGWRAIWFNPSGEAVTGLAPQHTAELACMTDLPGALDLIDLPSIAQSHIWLAEQGASANLVVHVDMVAALAYQMAVWLRQAGEQVNPVLAHRGGLLHDLVKIPALAVRVDHGQMAADLLIERAQPELAEIARRHILFNLVDDRLRPRTWEEKLVYYADKLVESSQIVSFQERLTALRERYKIATPEDEMTALIDSLGALELEICRPMGFTPVKLLENLKLAYYGKY